ncbi:MAG TPA: hypothetical protein VJY37_00535, partial [Anaerovoracaceae bacterium]|nr:hypothetical protein [Anaerovoracaceae bacterium]
YNVRKSYLLINGSSAGLIAAIMATVAEGKKLVMARNCHKSIFNALTLGGIEPVYAYPETIPDYNISGEITPEEIARCLDENPDAEAVILPSPNYYGICSDIKAIATEVHQRGKVLIVDQAHGAHLSFFDQYINGDNKKSAEALGADLIINSTHKTLASLTQSAILNVNSDRVDIYNLENKLQAIQSSSPSYILMASLDINADLLSSEGKALVEGWGQHLAYFYNEAKAIPGLRVMAVPTLDYTKINIDMSELGIDGAALENLLMDDNIFVELVTGNIVMCMTGIGNTRADYDRLLASLGKIASEHCEKEAGSIDAASAEVQEHHLTKEHHSIQQTQAITTKKLQLAQIPRETKRVPLMEAAGKVCGFSIIPYPPGIPIICPGEIMDKEVLDYVAELRRRGEKVMGINDRGEVIIGQ